MDQTALMQSSLLLEVDNRVSASGPIDRPRGDTQSLSDEDLLRLCGKGESRALEELVRRYQAPIYRFLVRMMNSPEDAEEAAKVGAQALVVSNHGGRQLDGAPSSVQALPGIVDAVGSRLEVLFDGGVRTGQDVMRALALGARSCMIGRAYAYGLGAGGQAGVEKAISLIAKELETTMGLCGVNTIAEIDERVIAV